MKEEQKQSKTKPMVDRPKRFKLDIDEAERRGAQALSEVIDATLKCATGNGYTQIVIRESPNWKVKSSVSVRGDDGKYHHEYQQTFPDRPADEWIPVERIITHYPPDSRACLNLLARFMRPIQSDANERLANARAAVTERQLETEQAKAEWLQTQTIAKKIEATMWRRQFVDEELQRRMMVAVAEKVGQPITHMSEEEWRTYFAMENGFERYKEAVGVAQADIIEAALSEFAEDDEEEGDE